MSAWVETDSVGRGFLSRAGVGVVVSMIPVGLPGPEGEPLANHLLTIHCNGPSTGAGAIRFQVQAQIGINDPGFEIAVAAMTDQEPVVWAIQWHRHDWIPDDLPIGSLDLLTDTRAFVTELRPVGSGLAQAGDYVPTAWGRLLP